MGRARSSCRHAIATLPPHKNAVHLGPTSAHHTRSFNMQKPEVRFARRLASNDPGTRSRAVKSLKRWMASRSVLPNAFDEVELLKLWKGLYVSMWHSDKPLVQEELAETIASFVHILQRREVAILFIETFFKILNQEWHSIDRLRLDKFYLLIRRIVSHSFQLLKDSKWNKGLMQSMVELLQEGPMNPDPSKTCCGMQLHVVEVYLTELLCVATDSISSGGMVLLEPCCLLLANTKDSVVAETLSASVFEPIAVSRVKSKQLQVDLSELSGRLLQLAMNRQTLGRNRKLLYSLHKRFEEVAAGSHLQEGTCKRRKRTA